MAAIISEKFRVHNAHQFMESLSEGSRSFAETLTATPDSVIIQISGNVYGQLRVGDYLQANNELRTVVSVEANGTQLSVNTAFSYALTDASFTSLDELISYDTYYLFIGRPNSWPDGDSVVPTPTDSVENTTFDYWRDIMAFHRITANNLIHVAPRYPWTLNTHYNMYDHRMDQAAQVSNTSHPQYVVTSEYQVFKCLYNGRSSSTSGGARSTGEPTITPQSDITDLTWAAGVPHNYVWKYLYTIPGPERAKYLTTNYIPVQSSWALWDENGDVLDDGSLKYEVFDAARSHSNGAIYRVVVESPGAGYTNPPTIVISGDGTDAEATAEISSGQVVAINISYGGDNYSFATVSITANGQPEVASVATATAIISPRNRYANSSGVFYVTNHGISLEEELCASNLMLYVELAGREEGGVVETGNEYRRVGIVRNPTLRGTSTVASGNVYSQTTDLKISGGQTGTFTKDEIIWQPSTNAYGVLVEEVNSAVRLVSVHGEFSSTVSNTYIMGIGNGTAGGQVANSSVTIPTTPDVFSPTVPASGASAYIDTVTLPAITQFSGDILYAEQRLPVVRADAQTEIIRTILTF